MVNVTEAYYNIMNGILEFGCETPGQVYRKGQIDTINKVLELFEECLPFLGCEMCPFSKQCITSQEVSCKKALRFYLTKEIVNAKLDN